MIREQAIHYLSTHPGSRVEYRWGEATHRCRLDEFGFLVHSGEPRCTPRATPPDGVAFAPVPAEMLRAERLGEISPGHLTPAGAELKRRALVGFGRDAERPLVDRSIDFATVPGVTLADLDYAQASIDMGAGPYTTKAELLAWMDANGRRLP
jgi:hypothetical protein